MKKFAGFVLNEDIYHKIHTLHMVKNMFFGEKEFSMSLLAEIAIREYFDNHKEEIDELMKTYHERGGCAEL